MTDTDTTDTTLKTDPPNEPFRRPGGTVTQRLAKAAASIDILERELINLRRTIEEVRGIL